MYRKKLLSFLVALCLLLTGVSALAEVTLKGEFPVVDEPVTLRVAMPINARVEDVNTNLFTLWLEEKTGVHLEFIELSESDTATQVNAIMLSGDLPDVFMGYNFSYSELAAYADAGLIVPLNEYVEKFGDEYYTFLEQLAPNVGNAEAYVTIDGNIYAVPTAGDMITNMYAIYKIRIPETFLEALGMEMPTTLDEFYDYLVAVRDQDANQNGILDDEIPMTGRTGSKSLVANLGNCFQYTDPDTYLKLSDGKVEFVGANDEFKEMVEFTKKLVDENLLDPAAFTQDQAMLLTLNTQEHPLIGADAAYASANYDSSSELFNSLRLLPNLVGPDGYSATKVTPPAILRTLIVTKVCQNPAAAFRLFDFLLTDEAGVVSRLGTENVHWKAAEEGKVGRDGNPAWYELLCAQVWTLPSQNVIWRVEGHTHADVMNHVAEDPASSIGKLAADIFALDLIGGVTGEQLPSLLMDVQATDEYTELKTLIVNYVDENIAKFALGDRPMSEWDAYVATIRSMNVDAYVRLAQDAYDAMK